LYSPSEDPADGVRDAAAENAISHTGGVEIEPVSTASAENTEATEDIAKIATRERTEDLIGEKIENKYT
jgi:hypothetical protein